MTDWKIHHIYRERGWEWNCLKIITRVDSLNHRYIAMPYPHISLWENHHRADPPLLHYPMHAQSSFALHFPQPLMCRFFEYPWIIPDYAFHNCRGMLLESWRCWRKACGSVHCVKRCHSSRFVSCFGELCEFHVVAIWWNLCIERVYTQVFSCGSLQKLRQSL